MAPFRLYFGIACSIPLGGGLGWGGEGCRLPRYYHRRHAGPCRVSFFFSLLSTSLSLRAFCFSLMFPLGYPWGIWRRIGLIWAPPSLETRSTGQTSTNAPNPIEILHSEPSSDAASTPIGRCHLRCCCDFLLALLSSFVFLCCVRRRR